MRVFRCTRDRGHHLFVASVRELRESVVGPDGKESYPLAVEDVRVLEVKGCACCGAPAEEAGVLWLRATLDRRPFLDD